MRGSTPGSLLWERHGGQRAEDGTPSSHRPSLSQQGVRQIMAKGLFLQHVECYYKSIKGWMAPLKNEEKNEKVTHKIIHKRLAGNT